jgi:hypothetical protein
MILYWKNFEFFKNKLLILFLVYLLNDPLKIMIMLIISFIKIKIFQLTKLNCLNK